MLQKKQEHEPLEIETVTIDKIFQDQDLQKIDLLKIEAEGAEPEVLEGLKNAEVRQIVVSTTPERSGQRPIKEVKKKLDSLGFNTKTHPKQDFVYAWK